VHLHLEANTAIYHPPAHFHFYFCWPLISSALCLFPRHRHPS
jgi:hypothetical protein